MILSQRAMNISASMTLAIDAKAKKMKSDGIDVVGFGAGEPDFGTPENIKTAAIEAIHKGLTRYTPASGTLELKKAICKKLMEDNHLEYFPENIVISNGAKHSLFNVMQAILNPCDEVLILSPYWVSYPELVKMAEGVPVFIDTFEEDQFKPKIENIEKKITRKTKAMIINSPRNPTGSILNLDDLKSIAELCASHDLMIISDEIYEKLIYNKKFHISIASLGEDIKKRTIVVNGMSKAFAMTGWRIGYTASEHAIAEIMDNYQSHATSNPNSIAQYASIEALTGPKDDLKKMVKEFQIRRDYMFDRINSINRLSCVKPEGAFYIMMNISQLFGKELAGKKINDSLTFSDLLLENQKVAVVPGIAFGDDRYVRLSYAVSIEIIKKGLDRIEAFVNLL